MDDPNGPDWPDWPDLSSPRDLAILLAIAVGAVLLTWLGRGGCAGF
jgi:hypothetical protein